MTQHILDNIVITSARGRKASPLSLEYVRDLNAQDLDLIINPPAMGIKTPVLGRLRSAHHSLARLLAEGVKAQQASMITGYSPSRISILKQDPAFQDLITYYKSQVEGIYLNVHERLAALGMTTIEELQERLEQDPDAFSNKELMELAELTLDRSVTPGSRPASAGPGGSGLSINISFVKPEDKSPVDITPKGTGLSKIIDVEGEG